jgi:hypothetical protein
MQLLGRGRRKWGAIIIQFQLKKIVYLNIRIIIKPHCLAFLIGKLYLIIISLDTRIKVEAHIIWFFDVHIFFNILPPSHTLDKHSDENENGNEWMQFWDWSFVRIMFFWNSALDCPINIETSKIVLIFFFCWLAIFPLKQRNLDDTMFRYSLFRPYYFEWNIFGLSIFFCFELIFEITIFGLSAFLYWLVFSDFLACPLH